MTTNAWIDYPILAALPFSPSPSTFDEVQNAMHEIEKLRRWKEEATEVIERWERCFDALEESGASRAGLGAIKSDHVYDWIAQVITASRNIKRRRDDA